MSKKVNLDLSLGLNKYHTIKLYPLLNEEPRH